MLRSVALCFVASGATGQLFDAEAPEPTLDPHVARLLQAATGNTNSSVVVLDPSPSPSPEPAGTRACTNVCTYNGVRARPRAPCT